MSKRIFKDSAMQEKLERQGFVVVKFLDEAEVDFLNRFFDELHPSPQGGFMSGSYSGDFKYKKKFMNLYEEANA